jgi:predicted RNase H-like nuclease
MRHNTGVRALGIDVSYSRGLDLVLLDDDRSILETHRRIQPGELAGLIGELSPDVVGIDSPPGWGIDGGSRLTERELRTFGIHSYGTPADPKKADNAFYDWMRVGMEAFAAAETAGYSRYRNGSAKHHAMEVFPHASAVVLAGFLPPKDTTKQQWRRQVLRANGVAAEELRSLDQVDAALAALTGLYALSGRFTALGDPREGVIVLPSHALPATPYRRSTKPPKVDPQMHLPGLTPCGCGDPGCTELTQGEFARGHDSKRKAWLWEEARRGEEALEELRRRGWEIPPEIR